MASRHRNDLTRTCFVSVSVQTPTLDLHVRYEQLGSAFAERLDLAQEAHVVAQKVAADCDETVHVAVLDGTHVVYIAKVDSTHPVRMVSAVGRRLPAHCTGVGKMLLSGLSFLGLGLTSIPSLGKMVADSTSYYAYYPLYLWAPVTVFVLLTLSLNLLGDSIRDALDPKLLR